MNKQANNKTQKDWSRTMRDIAGIGGFGLLIAGMSDYGWHIACMVAGGLLMAMSICATLLVLMFRRKK